MIKKYFEHGDNLKIQMNEIQKFQLSNDSNTSNFIQGNLWQQKISNYSQEKIFIPYFLYIDDVEINKPLRSHSMVQKMSAIYLVFHYQVIVQN